MLHWLAGQKQAEGDPDATGLAEPPETPAPVFAVRAFKHAIFGTPQTAQPKPRRHSNTENARSRGQTRPERPQLTRPKSAGDARILEEPVVTEPISSPTKGILMTPGTAAAKRKTVSFGEHVLDNEGKRTSKSGIPDDCPGKFPSPWTKPGAPEEQEGATEKTDKVRGRSKLTAALEQAREDSSKRPAKSNRREKSAGEEDVTNDLLEPLSDSGKYWKTQYDSYRDNSQREIRKLITKQKAAKSFAREKDNQCDELTAELRQERRKVERLEKRTVELQAQLEALQLQLKQRNETPPNAENVANNKIEPVVTREKTSIADRVAPTRAIERIPQQSSETVLTKEPPQEAELSQPAVVDIAKKARPEPKPEQAQIQQAALGGKPLVELDIKSKPARDTIKARNRARPSNIRTKTSDDIWNQSIDSSGLGRPLSPKRPSSPLKAGRPVTSGTDSTPLQSLNINTLPTTKLERRDSAQPSPPSDRFTKEPLVRQEVIRVPPSDLKRNGSPLISPALPQLSPQIAREADEKPRSPLASKPTFADGVDESTVPVPASSPFLPSPVFSPPPMKDAKASAYFDRKAPASRPAAASTMRNESPTRPKARATLSENVKPTAAWNAISAPNTAVRISSLTDKSGRELDQDRITAARARLAAKGRGAS